MQPCVYKKRQKLLFFPPNIKHYLMEKKWKKNVLCLSSLDMFMIYTIYVECFTHAFEMFYQNYVYIN